MDLLRLAFVLVLLWRAAALNGKREGEVVVPSGPPPRVRMPLGSPAIDALPPYQTVEVATIHYDFAGATFSDVPAVRIELLAISNLFENSYGFNVRDIPIPRTSAAQASVESSITNLYNGLTGPDTLVIIIYGGHGNKGGTWTMQVSASTFYCSSVLHPRLTLPVYRGDAEVDWQLIDQTIIAPTGVDTLQIIDSCYSIGSTPAPEDVTPPSYAGRGAFAVLASASRDDSIRSDGMRDVPVAGSNMVAFTRAVIFTLMPEFQASGRLANSIAFTPENLFLALPVVGHRFAISIGDGRTAEGIVGSTYTPKYFQLASYNPFSRKIAPLRNSPNGFCGAI